VLMSSHILIIEDEPEVIRILTDLLHCEGCTVESQKEGRAGLQRAAEESFDLLILDPMLPGLGGFQVCQTLRQQGFDGAILILTAKGQVEDRVKGLRSGADDYVVKPFHPEELLARVEALLRRMRKAEASPVLRFQFGGVSVDFVSMEFLKNGEPFTLAAKESELLRLLINHRGHALSREQILKQVWKEQAFITARTVDVHIAWLRQKLEDNPQSPRHILTVRGEGYRFQR
jgi:two-component system alkaline phosphatase synthesis response regulator PhoP